MKRRKCVDMYYWEKNTATKFQTLNSLIKKLFLTPHQGNFSLREMETFTENHNQSRCSVLEPSPRDTSTIELLNLRLWDHCGGGGWMKTL